MRFLFLFAFLSATAYAQRPGTEISSGPVSGLLGAERANMLHLASLAPSGHNSQPWQINITDKNRWMLSLARERLLPAVDPAARESWLSAGAFLENLAQAGEDAGLCASYAPQKAALPRDWQLKINIATCTAKAHSLRAINDRRTLRKGLRPEPLRDDDLQFILGEDAATAVYYAPDSEQGRFIAEQETQANAAQSWRQEALRELADWIRWSGADILKYRNGLTPDSMELGGISGWFCRHFCTKESVLKKSFSSRSAKLAAEYAGQGGGWLILTGGASVPELIETGRAYERIALRATERKISLHPMSQPLEEEGFRDALETRLQPKQPAQFILRAGYADKYPAPVSPRMPLEQFVFPER